MSATTGIASQTLRVYDENLEEVTDKRITGITASTSNQTKTISGLNPCKEYYVTVENVRKQIRFHPRCGTSFLVLMLIVGIIIGLFIPINHPIIRPVVKFCLLPVTVGIGYELIKICARNDNIITRIIAAPGVWMQHITTKEPEDDMIEVAIAAMKDVIPENGEDIIK